MFQTHNCSAVGTESPNTDLCSDISYSGPSLSFCGEGHWSILMVYAWCMVRTSNVKPFWDFVVDILGVTFAQKMHHKITAYGTLATTALR